MLDIVQDVLPIGALEWQTLKAPKHAEAFPKQARSGKRCNNALSSSSQKFVTNRSGDSLKRMFDFLATTKIPSGDPKYLDNVRRAKRAQ